MCRSPFAYGGPSCRLNGSPGAKSRKVSYTRCFAHHACADKGRQALRQGLCKRALVLLQRRRG